MANEDKKDFNAMLHDSKDKKSSVPVLLCGSEKRRLIGGAYFIFSFRRAA